MVLVFVEFIIVIFEGVVSILKILFVTSVMSSFVELSSSSFMEISPFMVFSSLVVFSPLMMFILEVFVLILIMTFEF